MAQTRLRPEQVRLDLDWNFTGHLSVGEDGIIAATRLLDIDGITTGFGAVLTPSMAIDSPLFYGLYTRLETEVAAITVTDAISLFVEDPIKGAGSTMTNLYGLCIEDLTQGTARNWAVCIRGDNPIVWGADTNLYRGGANILKTDDSLQATRIFTGDGLVGTPAYAFISDVDTGMYRIGVNDLGFTTNSTLALELNAVQQALVTNGTAAAPGLGFISDPDTGLYRIGANRLGIATAGAFAGEVSAAGWFSFGRLVPSARVDIDATKANVNTFNNEMLEVWDDTALAANVGGAIMFGGIYTAGGARGHGASIACWKKNAVDGEYGFGLHFNTRVHGAVPAIRMTIDDTGGVFMLALKSGANQAAAGAAVDELWHDTDDESIKIGV